MPPKRNVAFIKPDEPNFLKRMKAQIPGYQEADTIDAKHGPIGNASDDDDDDEFQDEKEDERPQVVQLREGDLTAEEAATIEKDEAEKPADLSQRVIFKASKKKKDEPSEKKDQSSTEESSKPKSSKKKGKDKEKPSKSLLSFGEEEDEDEG